MWVDAIMNNLANIIIKDEQEKNNLFFLHFLF